MKMNLKKLSVGTRAMKWSNNKTEKNMQKGETPVILHLDIKSIFFLSVPSGCQ